MIKHVATCLKFLEIEGGPALPLQFQKYYHIICIIICILPYYYKSIRRNLRECNQFCDVRLIYERLKKMYFAKESSASYNVTKEYNM